jgi:adenylate kinase
MQLLVFALSLLVTSLGLALVAVPPNPPTSQRVLILLGPPGSGKGTQAARLSKELKLPHISTGDLFRENISKNTSLGQKAKTFMDAGKLVPDALVLDMVYDRVAQPDCVNGYILDGFPRTIPQAEALDSHLQGVHLKVLNLAVPDEAILKRITGRMTCQQCGNIQHTEFSPPKIAGQCDKCGGALVQRKDDNPETVKERLRVYHAQTAPLIDYYTKQGKLTEIDGQKAPDEVFQALVKAINSK